MVKPFCCSVGCEAEPEFTIFTQREGGGVMGPDPYCDETQSCAAHVGELLGCQPDAVNPHEARWLVVPIAKASLRHAEVA